VYTSFNDDAHGGDTNGDGSATQPAKLDWGWIEFADSSDDGASFLEYCTIFYGGYENRGPYTRSNYGAITLWNASPTVSHCTFADNYINGIDVPNSTMAASATENTRTWHNTDVVYTVSESVTIAEGMKLLIAPGVIVKFRGGSRMIVQGALDARGTPEKWIVFTSFNDDAHGGDTDADGSDTPPKPKDWKQIQFEGSSNDLSCYVEHGLILYSEYGITLKAASPTVRHNTIAYNTNGVWAESGSYPILRDNLFFANTDHAVRNQDSTTVIDAESNWWGHASGPYDPSDDRNQGGWYNPFGLGDKVSNYVDYEPWVGQFPATEGVIEPASGGAVYSADGMVTILFPAGSVEEAVRVTYTQASGGPLPQGLASTGHGFDLAAQTLDGQPVQTLLLPATIVISYGDDDLYRIRREGTLALYRWDGVAWHALPTSLDLTYNTAAATTLSMGTYDLLGEARHIIFLPLVQR
jgi:parallel beta-helix repeat protein